MIFEFFKRLFWKADEINRKRKASEPIFNVDEDDIQAKRLCHEYETRGHVKTNSPVERNHLPIKIHCNSHSSMHSKHYSSVTSQIESLKPVEWTNAKSCLSAANMDTSKKDVLSVPGQSRNQFTLHKTQRLAEKKLYSEMLLNFIPAEPKIEKCSKNLSSQESEKRRSSFTIERTSTPNYLNTSGKFQLENKYRSYRRSSTNNEAGSSLQQSVIDLEQSKSYVNRDSSIQSVSRSEPIEIIKTNTLKEKLINKAVMKHDYITNITKKYNERMEQRCKEAEELKKMTRILSKHNQLTREAALEEQLNRSMRLCEEVIDDRDELEEPRLPELTPEMVDRIRSALSMGSVDEVLVEGFGLRITRRDIQTLVDLNWLNDEVINFYMNLLISRGNSEKFPSVYAMNTFFYPKLLSGGHASLKRWTRKVDVFAKDLIVVPIHLGIHWCMSIIDLRHKTIHYYDSMGSVNNKCLQALKQYLHDESLDKKKKTFDFTDWSFECLKDIPQQMNGSDCGVFSCMFAEYVCANRKITFTQEDMPYFRNKMIYEILTSRLL